MNCNEWQSFAPMKLWYFQLHFVCISLFQWFLFFVVVLIFSLTNHQLAMYLFLHKYTGWEIRRTQNDENAKIMMPPLTWLSSKMLSLFLSKLHQSAVIASHVPNHESQKHSKDLVMVRIFNATHGRGTTISMFSLCWQFSRNLPCPWRGTRDHKIYYLKGKQQRNRKLNIEQRQPRSTVLFIVLEAKPRTSSLSKNKVSLPIIPMK